MLDAADKNLAQHQQENVTVAGSVARLSWTTAHNAVNIEFEGPESASLLIWVSPSAIPKLKEALGDDFEQKLTGAKLQIHGRLLKYGGLKADWKNRLQITFDNKDNIQILSSGEDKPSVSTPTAVPASGEQASQEAKPPADSKQSSDAAEKSNPPVAATETAKPPVDAPPAETTPAPPAAKLDAEPLDAASEQLAQHVGENVVVTGHVQHVGWTAAHTGLNIEFDGPEKSGLLIWVSPKSLPKLKEGVGEDFEQKLNGAQLEVRGKLTKYAGSNAAWVHRLQISYGNKDQIKILSDDGNNSSSPPSMP